MAIIPAPASASLPSMIPPADFPPDNEFRRFPRGTDEAGGSAPIPIEACELHVLTGFLAAFSRYLAARHDPEASAGVMERYRAALRFYDGLERLRPEQTARQAVKRRRRPGSGRKGAPPGGGTRKSGSGRGRSL